MLSHLLTTRPCSSIYRKIAKCPVKGGEKLTTNALGVYIKQNYHKVAKGSSDSMKAIATLRGMFNGLSGAQMSKYQSIANANRETVAARLAVLRSTHATGYLCFVKKNFAGASQQVRGKGVKNSVATVKSLAEEWGHPSSREKASFNAEAARIKKAAVTERSKMIDAYYAYNDTASAPRL